MTILEILVSHRFQSPKKTVQLLQEKLFPKTLMSVMQQELEYQETLRKDVVEYVDMLCIDSKACEKYKHEEKPRSKDNSNGKTSGNKFGGASGPSNKDKGKTENRGTRETDRRNGKQRPLCLSPVCEREGRRHYVIDECEWTSRKHGEKLLEEFKAKKAKDHNGNSANRVCNHREDASLKSTMVEAMFAKKVKKILCADGGSDVNLISPEILQDLLEKGTRVKVTEFESPKQFGLAATNNQKGEEIFVTCNKQVVMNIELFIRHGCFLELRNIKWYVAMSEMAEPILGRPILEALGINTRFLIAAAVDKVGSSLDVSHLDGYQGSPGGSVARVLNEGIYHRDKGMTSDEYDDEDEAWLDLGKDTEQEVDNAILNAVQKAEDNGISNTGKKTLSSMLNTYRDILRLRLGNYPPALVDAGKVELKEDLTPVAAKTRRYTRDGGKFMERYVNRVIEYGFGKVTTEAKWVAAPVLVAKTAPALFRLTFDYRPINDGADDMAYAPYRFRAGRLGR